MTTFHSSKLFKQLLTALNEVSQGNTTHVETIFELTKEGVYPPEIANLAEACGMMIVQIDARQQRLERLLADLQEKNNKLELVSGNLLNANIGMLEVLGSAIAKRDSDTSAHNYRVTIHSIYLGKALELDENSLRSLIKGAFLHDIGKIAISDAILHKPGKLNEQEFETIKSHVQHGSEIITSYPWLADAQDVVLRHHEKFNGSGYPGRLIGGQIPVNARIFAVADVFDALISKRPYKEAYPFEKVMAIMAADAGSHFDPSIFEVFSRDAWTIHETIAGFSESQLTSALHTIMLEYFAVPSTNSLAT